MSSRKKIRHLCVCKAAVDPPPKIKLTKTHMLLQQKLQQQLLLLLQPQLISSSSSSSSAAELYLEKTANMQSSAGLKHDRKLNHKPGLQREREREEKRSASLHKRGRDREREREEGNERGE